MKIALTIIGCGAIGNALAEYAAENMERYISSVILYDVDGPRAQKTAERIKGASSVPDAGTAVEKAGLVIEACSGAAVPGLLRAAIEKRRDIMIMSTGGLIGHEGLIGEAREKGIKIIMPSGAIAGIDALKAARIAGLRSVTLTTRKSPGSLRGAPYLAENDIDIDSIRGETVIFEGAALDAIKGFPKNVNVSALLSIAGIGPERTKVRIISSPEYASNTHEVSVLSDAGSFLFRTENVPFPSNPGTSYLAALSAMAALEGYFTGTRIGT